MPTLAVSKLILLLVALAASAPAQKAAKPSFSGAWDLVLAKSDFGKIAPPKKCRYVVEHKEPILKLFTNLVLAEGEYNAEITYRSTGAEDTNESYGVVTRSRSRWENNQLVTDSEVDAKGSKVAYTERWSLADGGKTWINERVVKLSGGDVKQKLVFARVK